MDNSVLIDVNKWTNASTPEFWGNLTQIGMYAIGILIALLLALSLIRGTIHVFHLLRSSMNAQEREKAKKGLLRCVISFTLLAASVPIFLLATTSMIDNQHGTWKTVQTTDSDNNVDNIDNGGE